MQVARLGALAPHLAGRPAEIAEKWFGFRQTRKWFSEENRKQTHADLWQTFYDYEESEEKQFQSEALIALIQFDHKFFSDLAKAVKHFADTQGKPVDPVRHALLTYCNAEEGIYVGPAHTRRKHGKATVIHTTANAPVEAGWFTVKKAREVVEQLTGQRLDEAQIRRVLKQCGLLKAETKKRKARNTTTLKTAKPEPKHKTTASLKPSMLGLPPSFPKRSFWTRADVQHQLHQAQAAYRAQMRRVHPDKGGNADTFRKWRNLWRNVKNNFRRHGFTLT